METKKVEKIPGTRYVKVDNSVFAIEGKDNTPKRVICECLWCGERFGGNASGGCAMYCKHCKKAEQRKQTREENEKL